MNQNKIIKIALNFLAVVMLASLIAAPIYFAKNFAKVAGVKSETSYLIVSQIEKFPGMFLNQDGNKYEISFTRQFTSQAFLSVAIINNPTSETKTYNLKASSGSTKVFLGEDLTNPITQIKVPAESSVPISLLSEGDAPSTQTVEFTIEAK